MREPEWTASVYMRLTLRLMTDRRHPRCCQPHTTGTAAEKLPVSIVFWRVFDKAVRGKPPSVAAAQTMEPILWPAEGRFRLHQPVTSERLAQPGEGPRLSEERQVSMVITRGLQSRKLAASACGMKMTKLGSTRDVAPRWDPRA